MDVRNKGGGSKAEMNELDNEKEQREKKSDTVTLITSSLD